jgi:hypothetical protein
MGGRNNHSGNRDRLGGCRSPADGRFRHGCGARLDIALGHAGGAARLPGAGRTFFVMLVAELCVPNYYTVQFGGLPWISARRVATFALVAPFLLAISSSSQVRHEITERLRSAPLILVCVLGFLAMAS